MATVVLHNGHKNVNMNPDPNLHGSTGASGELDWIEDFQRNYVEPALAASGHTVKFTDGRGPNQDFDGDAFIADHYDGAPHAGAYWCIARAANDPVAAQSDHLVALLIDRLGANAQVRLDQTHVTDNMRYYYGFSYFGNRPECIIEHGNGADPSDYALMHDSVYMTAQAQSMVEALNDYFGNVPAPAVKPTREEIMITDISQIGAWTYEPAMLKAAQDSAKVGELIQLIRQTVINTKALYGA